MYFIFEIFESLHYSLRTKAKGVLKHSTSIICPHMEITQKKWGISHSYLQVYRETPHIHTWARKYQNYVFIQQ